jgi:hypothetical protein
VRASAKRVAKLPRASADNDALQPGNRTQSLYKDTDASSTPVCCCAESEEKLEGTLGITTCHTDGQQKMASNNVKECQCQGKNHCCSRDCRQDFGVQPLPNAAFLGALHNSSESAGADQVRGGRGDKWASPKALMGHDRPAREVAEDQPQKQ